MQQRIVMLSCACLFAERLEPDCIEAFDECSSEFTQKLAELFCMENGDSCPTEPLLGVYPVVKVVDVDV